MCKTETDLGRDERLKKVRTNKKLRKQSQRKKGKKVDTEQDVDEDYIRMMNQLKTDEAVMPRNIKLLLEYDASIGKEGKSFIPDSHNGMISYGTEETANDSSESSLTNWHAMIIGPQEVIYYYYFPQLWMFIYSWYFFLVTNWSSNLFLKSYCTKRISKNTTRSEICIT